MKVTIFDLQFVITETYQIYNLLSYMFLCLLHAIDQSKNELNSFTFDFQSYLILWYLSSISGLWKVASKVAVITMLGAMSGGISAVLLSFARYHQRKYIIDIPDLSCGILAGCVSITSGASVIRPWEAIIIGLIGGFIANGCK